MKVFGIGLNKTGTTTLGEALKLLGYRHHGLSLDLLDEWLKNGFSEDIKQVIEENDAFEDWPWPLMWIELARFYPDAKFVLTIRSSSEKWFESQCKHIIRYPDTRRENLMIYGCEDPKECRSIFVDYYINHNEKVKSWFIENGLSDRLLIVCWENGDGWKELCDFLDLTPPMFEFPHSNSSTIPMEFKYFWMGQNKLAIKTAIKSIVKQPIKGIGYYRGLFYLIRRMKL